MIFFIKSMTLCASTFSNTSSIKRSIEMLATNSSKINTLSTWGSALQWVSTYKQNIPVGHPLTTDKSVSVEYDRYEVCWLVQHPDVTGLLYVGIASTGTLTPSLYWMRFGTSSQCNSSSSKCDRPFFAARCYASVAYAVMRCLCVCPCVCVSVGHVREFCQNE